jgi:hypothetical protein
MATNQKFTKMMLSSHQMWSDAIVGMEDEVSILLKEQTESAVDKSVQNMIEIASRSALVFGHSVLDAALTDLLQFSAEIDGSAFTKYVLDKKRSAKDFLNADSKTLHESLVRDFLEQLGRESVVRKLDVLFGACTPDKSCFADEMYPEFMYDKTRVERVDRQRHDVVHALSKSPVEIEDIFYLDYVTRVAYCTFATRHQVTFDKEAAKEFFRQDI